HQLQALDDVVRHDLHREVRSRTVTGAVVGGGVDEQVGESRHGASAVGAWAVPPLVGKFLATAATDVHRGQEVQVVSGGVDDDVEVDLPAVGGHDPVWIYLGRLAGFHIHVIAGQRRVVPARVA